MDKEIDTSTSLPSPGSLRKPILFIDRDGTLIVEPAETLQVDRLDQLEFLPGVFRNLYRISKYLDFELVMVSNQDGLGTRGYPQEAFELVQDKLLKSLSNEGINFKKIHIDKSFPQDHLPTRKPAVGMLQEYFGENYDLKNSYVIGDRITDIELAKNLGAKGILIGSQARKAELEETSFASSCVLITDNWDDLTSFLFLIERSSEVHRTTSETDVLVSLNLDGTGQSNIDSGLGFFNHMLDQIARHSGCDIQIKVTGDLDVDEHHTIEDTAISLGEAFFKALVSKRGLERYGFALPMDDSSAQVLIDFGGRPWLVWNTEFKREKVGDVPTEMFYHFFKSFADSARCNIRVQADGINEHHKIESIFKSFARAIRMAIRRDPWNFSIPTTKGVL
jgi:imidazoleglycerol-phosphate dehydratase / histidinol-phosphatase